MSGGPLQKETIIFLSTGDIKYDGRIIKSIETAYQNGAKTIGFGIIDRIPPSKKSSLAINSNILSINLISRRISFKFVRYIFSIFEYNLRGLFFALNNRPTLIHCNDYVPLPLAILIKIFCRSKLIYDAHELESDKNGQSRFSGFLVLVLEFISWPFIDSFITVSFSIKNWYIEHFPRKKTSIVLNTPYLESNFIPNKTYLRDKFQIPKSHKIFIYVGVLMKGRCLPETIECFKDKTIKKDSALVILGSGSLKNNLTKIISTNDNIYFHDAVAHEDVVKIASSADYGLCLINKVSLSDYLTLPNKLFEYIFSGIPVLCSDFPDMRKIIKDLKAGIVCEPMLEGIMEAIKRINKEKLNFDSNKETLYRYSWDYQQQKLLSHYINTIKK